MLVVESVEPARRAELVEKEGRLRRWLDLKSLTLKGRQTEREATDPGAGV